MDERRLTDMLSAERALVAARWFAIVFAFVQVQTYAAMPYPTGARVTAFMLVAALAVTSVMAALAVSRVETARAATILAVATLVADLAIVVGFVWLYTFDEGSVHLLVLFVLPAEAALKFQLRGALAAWAVLAGLYTAREAWAAPPTGSPSASRRSATGWGSCSSCR